MGRDIRKVSGVNETTSYWLTKQDFTPMFIRTHKIALRPTRRQHRLLEQCSDYARFAYNWTLRYFRGKPAAERERKYQTSLLYLVWDDARASVCAPGGGSCPRTPRSTPSLT